MRIAVLFGGRSGEHAVSLMSARSVIAALDAQKYEIIQIGITRQGRWLMGQHVLDALERESHQGLTPVALLPEPQCPPVSATGLYALRDHEQGALLEKLGELDLVFPVLHGTFGEDGTMQGLFELAEVAYVGAGVLASAVAMDKALFKEVMRAQGIPTLESILVLRSEVEADIESVVHRAEQLAPYPLFAKPANLGSSVGITKCYHRADLVEGALEAAQFDRRILIERGISGRELEVSVLGNDRPQASVVGEIIPAGDFYTYESKYHDDRSELLIPARVPPAISERVRELAVQAYRAIDGAGMARADFLLDKDTGELYLNEINTIPGFTQISMYSKLWEASGLSYPDLVDRLIELAMERHGERVRTVRDYHREEEE